LIPGLVRDGHGGGVIAGVCEAGQRGSQDLIPSRDPLIFGELHH
jgi:hypothetical protein